MVFLLRLCGALSVVGAIIIGVMFSPSIPDHTALTESCARGGPVPGLMTRECEDAAFAAVNRSRALAAQIWGAAIGSGLVSVLLFFTASELLTRSRRTDEALADLAHRFDDFRRRP